MKNFELQRKNVEMLATHLLLIAILLVVLFPIFYIISMSFDATAGIGKNIMPSKFSLDHWKCVLGLSYQDAQSGQMKVSNFPMLRWLYNSLKVSFVASFSMLFLATTSAYALSRFRFQGRQLSLVALMLLQMFPGIMSMVAFFLMLDFLGRYIPALGADSHGGLILVYLGGTPFNIWLIKGYFDTLPKSIEESAIMDGCTRFQVFYKIVLPLSAPILAVVGLLTFIGTFSDFILPSILLKSHDKLTFAIGIHTFISESFSERWGPFAAACILGAIPISAIFLAIHKYIISGLAAGASKG